MLRLTVLVLAAGLLIISPAASAPPATGALKQAAALQLITELQQSKTLLETAIHDYDGYRGKAVHEVHQAIRDLEEHHRKPTTGTGTTKPAAPAVTQPVNPPAPKPEPTPEQQKASDAQLQAAIVILTQAEQTLSTSTHPTHVKAAAHLKEAISNLNIALMKK